MLQLGIWNNLNVFNINKLETFEDALFESGKTSTHKTEKTGTLDLLPCGKRNAEMVEIW